ncbi:hypothetical protein LAZ67_4001752 [Cordylochernes scorpioides]|uniref:Helitron helicase-like domain-containing protein n=1 Tax=Cordylochernes scorpioides TaxID=51811 RepID=A0ABY6KF90_9ARAC|nr:hypothetical protein LAZ67_4001752 [Cordylochernes scorpioides]
MELPLSSPAKCELRSVIRFLNAKNNSPVEIHRQLVEVYGEKCMDIKNVRKWCRDFNEGRINVHDEQRSGRPSLPESTVARIDEMVRANRRITLEDIEDGLNEDCSHFSVHKIVSETLGYRKVSARCVDKWLKEAAGEWYNTGITNDAYRVVVNADRTPPGQHPRQYNAPTANEVAVVLAGNQFGSRDIVLHQRDNLLQHVSDTHCFYDALQYPLIFWKGQEGYSFHIPQIDPNTRQPLSSKVSSMDFYGYFIMVRRNSPNVIVQFGQLFHQFLVDMYAKVESERLRYITLHQRNLRAESYIHLRDALSTDANINPNSLGQRIILPSSFVNSPRYLAEYTQDAFCYVRKFGRPDLFITFTSNPSWEELSAALLPGQKQLDRHDITARVFSAKIS